MIAAGASDHGDTDHAMTFRRPASIGYPSQRRHRRRVRSQVRARSRSSAHGDQFRGVVVQQPTDVERVAEWRVDGSPSAPGPSRVRRRPERLHVLLGTQAHTVQNTSRGHGSRYDRVSDYRVHNHAAAASANAGVQLSGDDQVRSCQLVVQLSEQPADQEALSQGLTRDEGGLASC